MLISQGSRIYLVEVVRLLKQQKRNMSLCISGSFDVFSAEQ
jgi:hypothetical protein